MRIALPWMLAALFVGCSVNDLEYIGDSNLIDGGEEDRILLVDQDGLEYDITHAVTHYGFDPDRIFGGTGLERFRPYVDPSFLSPGDPGYPGDASPVEVIGVQLEGHTRAYALDDLAEVEIVDEIFGDAHVAVGW